MGRMLSKDAVELLNRKPKRKIIETHVLNFKMGDYYSCYIVAFCNDGTLWKHIDPGKDADEPEEWFKLKDIPQPGHEE